MAEHEHGFEYCVGVLSLGATFRFKTGQGIRVQVNAPAEKEEVLKPLMKLIGGSTFDYRAGHKSIPISQRKAYVRYSIQSYKDIEKFIDIFAGRFSGLTAEKFDKMAREFRRRKKEKRPNEPVDPFPSRPEERPKEFDDDDEYRPGPHIGLPGDY